MAIRSQSPSSILRGSSALEVVSHCPQCGSPIYGPRLAVIGQSVKVLRTCRCGEEGQKDIRDSMHTK